MHQQNPYPPSQSGAEDPEVNHRSRQAFLLAAAGGIAAFSNLFGIGINLLEYSRTTQIVASVTFFLFDLLCGVLLVVLGLRMRTPSMKTLMLLAGLIFCILRLISFGLYSPVFR